jgi:hypothetical protein
VGGVTDGVWIIDEVDALEVHVVRGDGHRDVLALAVFLGVVVVGGAFGAAEGEGSVDGEGFAVPAGR